MSKVAKRRSSIGWVPLEQMRVRSGISQRDFRPAWANQIAREFQLEKFRRPVVNHVRDWYWIIDGQHSVDAFKQWLGDWSQQKVECEIHENLSEQEEADLFLALNNVKVVGGFDKFVSALTAGHVEATNIDAIVRLKGLKVSRQSIEGAVSCVGTLRRVYRRGEDCLARDLEIVYQSFGDTGLDADILDGIGLLVSRYDGALDDKKAIQALSAVRGGVNALRSRAERLRQQMGVQRSHCIAAAAVEIINRGKGGKKLPTWWKSEID